MTRILVVDDDPTVREVVLSYLKAEHYEVAEAADGETALSIIGSDRPDLVVLDVMLPGVDGLEVCRRARANGNSPLPIIMLTALGSESDRVVGLELGADDYVAKPFSPRELVLRVASVLRPAGERPSPDARVLTDGDLVLDGPSGTVALWDRSASGGGLPASSGCQIAGVSSSKPARTRCRAAASVAITCPNWSTARYRNVHRPATLT